MTHCRPYETMAEIYPVRKVWFSPLKHQIARQKGLQKDVGFEYALVSRSLLFLL